MAQNNVSAVAKISLSFFILEDLEPALSCIVVLVITVNTWISITLSI